MWNKILIFLCYIDIGLLKANRIVAWPYEKIFQFFYWCFKSTRERNLQEINQRKEQIWKMKFDARKTV